jgi:hypothetical protein
MTTIASTRTTSPQRGDLKAVENRLRVPPERGRYDESELAGLPEPVRRYFRAAIATGAPLARAATLRMRGRIKLSGRWLPFRARQVLAPHDGFVWRARVAAAISGADCYADGDGALDFRLLGLVRVAHEVGPDVTRSAAGRAAGESVWVPTALLPRFGVHWAAEDDAHLTARLSVDDVETVLNLRINSTGQLESVSFDRWGDPDKTGTAGLHPFGLQATATGTFDGLTIPAAGGAGWFHGTDRWSDGEFIRCQITAVQPVTEP